MRQVGHPAGLDIEVCGEVKRSVKAISDLKFQREDGSKVKTRTLESQRDAAPGEGAATHRLELK
jgi:hypothetical protein